MADHSEKQSSVKIGLKPFLTAVGIILVLVIVSGILTKVIPAGSYERIRMGERMVVVQDSYREIAPPDYPVWRWATAPIEVLWGDNWLMVAVIILFMIFLGGSLNILEQGSVMETMLALTVKKFQKRKYLLMALVMFVMMFLASVVGIYEALVPMIVFIVPLALSLGWDSLTGLGMSLLALAFGFSAAVTNPFTVAVAQMLSELPVYSGSWLRIIFFAVIYVLSFLFVFSYAKRVEKNPQKSLTFKDDEEIRHRYSPEMIFRNLKNLEKPGMKGAMVWFGSSLLLAILFILSAAFIPAVPAEYAFPVVSLLFLIGGLGAGKFVGFRWSRVLLYFLKGALNMAPGILLVLLAMSVPHIMTRGGIMDTILYQASQKIQGTGPYLAGFYVYLLTLFLNFFIGSASAKAFMVMPIIVPLAEVVGLTRQTMVLAFDFGDGFSNMIFPTNPLLLIGLSLASVSFTKWLRWTVPVQILIFALSMVFLYLAISIGFGPF